MSACRGCGPYGGCQECSDEAKAWALCLAAGAEWRRKQDQIEADARLGRAVRDAVDGWLAPGMTTATMPIDWLNGKHEITEEIARALRKERA